MTKQDMNMTESNKGMNNLDSQGLDKPVTPKGGSKSSANFKNDPARAAEAGRKGGSVSGGNFKNNPARAAEAGRKGGEASSSARKQQQTR